MTENDDEREEWKPKRPVIPNVPLMEYNQEFNIEDMERRAETYSDMDTLRKRKRRFDEELANEFTMVTAAKLKNLRFKRFKEEDDEEDQENEET